MTWKPEMDELRRRQELARRMGGADKVKRQHDGGRLTVRERIDRLVDKGSFREIGSIAGKAEYDLPMYLNAALIHSKGHYGTPSAGPLPHLMDCLVTIHMCIRRLRDRLGDLFADDPLNSGLDRFIWRQTKCHGNELDSLSFHNR